MRRRFRGEPLPRNPTSHVPGADPCPSAPRRPAAGTQREGRCSPPHWSPPASSSSPASADTTTYIEDFETRVVDDLAGSSGVSVGAAWAHDGLFGARAVSSDTTSGFLSWSRSEVDQGNRYARFGGWVQARTFDPAEEVGMFSVKNANGEHHFDFFRDAATGQWKWDLFRADHALSTMEAVPGRWYYVEAVVDFGGPGGTTFTADVEINGQPQTRIVSTGEDGSTVRSAWMGSPGLDRDSVRLYDSLSFQVGDAPFAFQGVPAS